jgi:hypothetical protein
MFGNPSVRFAEEVVGVPETVGSAGALLGRLTVGATVLEAAFGLGVTVFAGTAAAAGAAAEAAGLLLTMLAGMRFTVAGVPLVLVGRGAAAAV